MVIGVHCMFVGERIQPRRAVHQVSDQFHGADWEIKGGTIVGFLSEDPRYSDVEDDGASDGCGEVIVGRIYCIVSKLLLILCISFLS